MEESTLNEKFLTIEVKNKINKQTNKQTSGTLGKKIVLGVCSPFMVALNISLNAIQSVGRRAVELLLASTIGVVVTFVGGAIDGFFIPITNLKPKGWIGKGLCLLAGLFGAIINGVICTVHLLYNIAVEILKTSILLIVSACSWIYNGFVGFKRLFKSIGENELFVSNRYQNLGSNLEAQQKQPIIKKIAHMGVPGEDEKAQPVSFTQAAVRYTLGVVDVKSKDEVKKKQWIGLGDENEVQKTEYIVKPKSFPYRTGGYMIY